ncbi:hypothetical protein AK812_SmicGene22347 [Symbiodinium microadriaticum]|uniref:Uncharacterized protein n=1 Tax=Symbiodinium microadriaticum TaxID=2951 RepID=A0A1Q9DK48_SYMMI|nr:hypothetical protein AK812_SmicGene22347 [Symbiodinium microadriaticum]
MKISASQKSPSLFLIGRTALIIHRLLILPSAADFLAPRPDRMLEATFANDVSICENFDYKECVEGIFHQNMTESVKKCCERPVKQAWQTMRREMPWWGWPILAIGVVVVITCCATCLVRMGCELLCKILCCPCRSFCRCLCGLLVGTSSDDLLPEADCTAEAANAEASGTRAEAIKEGLQQARHALSRAEQEAARVSEEAQEALRTLETLCAERTRMKGETGPEAAKRRVQLTEALTREEDQLSAEQEQLKVQSKSAEEKLDWLRHLRDVQEYARSAAKESANNFRVAYTDIAKSSRSSTARPGAGTSPAPEAANRSARRLSRHLDDFLRFMAEVVAVGEAHDETSQLPLQMVNLNLPAVLKEAYMGKFVQSDDGMSQAQQLDSSKEKLKVLKRELNDAGHQNETQSLAKDLAELRRQIAEGEAKSREDRQRCEEAQQRLREGFKKAGYRRNEGIQTAGAALPCRCAPAKISVSAHMVKRTASKQGPLQSTFTLRIDLRLSIPHFCSTRERNKADGHFHLDMQSACGERFCLLGRLLSVGRASHGKRQWQSRKLRQLEVQKPQMLKSRPQPHVALSRSEVRAKDAGPLKSLLRPPRPDPPQTVWRYVRRKLAALGCRLRRRSGPGSRGVGFQPSVRVLSYPRKLCGGDGVPTDGSTIALGLGGVATENQVALSSGPRGVPSDQISWMPAEMRERVLADAMGPQSFASAQAELQPEMMQLLSLRRDTTEASAQEQR